ncbi:FAD dependent oxidoreductase [Xylariomycetidae sp. FL0641]|nr:FAD dependent oxidoreductase [Xylariomycetidae sp. FL0641]
MDSRMPRPRHIVIIGGGIIGTTTAYFLTRHPSYNPAIHHITLLEATSIAAGASGKAGGLLGLWAYPLCIVPLSYRLHAELAAEHGGAERWGYRRLECGQLVASVKSKDLKPKPKSKASTPVKVKQEDKQRGSDDIATTDSLPSSQQRDPLQQLLSYQRSLQDGQLVPPYTPQPPVQLPNGQVDGQESERDPHFWQKLPKQDEAAAALLRDSVLPADLDWINGELVGEYAEMGLPGYTETAQVHPYQFTTSLAELARSQGAEIRIGSQVTKIGLNGPGTAVRNIEYLDRATGLTHLLRGVTDVVVAAGPWTGRVLPQTKVSGIRAHSVVFDADVSPYAVFTNISLPANFVPAHRGARGEKRRRHRGSNVDPEIYARPGREVYACGETDPSVPLPDTADQVQCDDRQCDDLVAYIATVSSVLGAAAVSARQACYMPRHMRPGQESTPLVGATAIAGLWVAAGHTCWGIQNGPATGKLMSEFIFDGRAVSADAAELDPTQFKI